VNTMDIKRAIIQQKVAARRSIASAELRLRQVPSKEVWQCLKVIADEKRFLKHDFDGVNSIEDLLDIIHKLRHNSITRAGRYTRCKYCKHILAEEIPGAVPTTETNMPVPQEQEQDVLPKFGNLIAVLEQEVNEEIARMERVRMPSQNDITRWALKSAVLEFYKNMNVPEDTPIVINRGDDRLITELAPDFDVIAQMWTQKLDELQRRDDKYGLIMEEFDKAEEDLNDGMRGSAFEKQLDRYREEFMQKLMG